MDGCSDLIHCCLAAAVFAIAFMIAGRSVAGLA